MRAVFSFILLSTWTFVGCEALPQTDIAPLTQPNAAAAATDSGVTSTIDAGSSDSGGAADARVPGGGFSFDGGWGDARASGRDGSRPVDGGDGACGALAACCPELPMQVQGVCQNAAAQMDETTCADFLGRAQGRGACGGSGSADGGGRPARDGGGRVDGGSRGDGGGRRDGGGPRPDTGLAVDVGVMDGGFARDARPARDAGPLGPSCTALRSCCDELPAGQPRNRCLRGADRGDEMVCETAITRAQDQGLCLPDDAGA